MIASILAALKALPQILDLLSKLGGALKKMDLEKDLAALEEVTNELDKADSLQQKLAAGRKLNDLFKRL